MMIGNNTGTNETWKRIPENSVGAELGVWKGDSSIKFLKRCAHLHLVDSWSVIAYENSDEHGNYEKYIERYSKLVGSSNPEDFQKYYDKIYNNVVKKFENQSVTIHRMSTEEWFNSFNEKLDWVYVDASHSYDGCLFDLRNSLKILKKDGIIFGDDYGNKEGVKKAVDQFIDETKLPFEKFSNNQFQINLSQ